MYAYCEAQQSLNELNTFKKVVDIRNDVIIGEGNKNLSDDTNEFVYFER